MKVKITKIAESSSPKYPTSDKETYVYGKENKTVSPPIDYWIIGELASPIVVGASIFVYRSERNGVKCAGIFKTSPISKIEEGIAETANSKYQIEYIVD
jgi:hypothetical protein